MNGAHVSSAGTQRQHLTPITVTSFPSSWGLQAWSRILSQVAVLHALLCLLPCPSSNSISPLCNLTYFRTGESCFSTFISVFVSYCFRFYSHFSKKNKTIFFLAHVLNSIRHRPALNRTDSQKGIN